MVSFDAPQDEADLRPSTEQMNLPLSTRKCSPRPATWRGFDRPAATCANLRRAADVHHEDDGVPPRRGQSRRPTWTQASVSSSMIATTTTLVILHKLHPGCGECAGPVLANPHLDEEARARREQLGEVRAALGVEVRSLADRHRDPERVERARLAIRGGRGRGTPGPPLHPRDRSRRSALKSPRPKNLSMRRFPLIAAPDGRAHECVRRCIPGGPRTCPPG
jgi:hypothetical protein